MTKVVYNACCGGFSFSAKASDLLNKLGIETKCGLIGCNSFYLVKDIPRHDLRLVQVVEELGSEASGAVSMLEIAEVRGKYRIEEYNGFETVQEPKDIEWVKPL
jgi:hypothetical protein